MEKSIFLLAFLISALAFFTSCTENNKVTDTDHKTANEDSAMISTTEETETGNTNIPWTPDELMQPQQLAEKINSNAADKPVIFNMGPSGNIKGAIEIGPAEEEPNMQKLQTELSKLTTDKPVVVYCGCCPYKRCPNVRPAFALLKDMNFVNGKLLDLPENLKTDWINKSYPMAE